MAAGVFCGLFLSGSLMWTENISVAVAKGEIWKRIMYLSDGIMVSAPSTRQYSITLHNKELSVFHLSSISI